MDAGIGRISGKVATFPAKMSILAALDTLDILATFRYIKGILGACALNMANVSNMANIATVVVFSRQRPQPSFGAHLLRLDAKRILRPPKRSLRNTGIAGIAVHPLRPHWSVFEFLA
jgi:hypothetical protein